MLVKELMTKEVEWISPETPIAEAARKMRDLDIGCLPVGENDRLIGMITDRDIAIRGVAAAYHPATTPVREIMTAGINYCFEDEEIADVAAKMESTHVRRLPVLNQEKRMIGFLSVGDIAARCPDLSGEVLDAVAPHH